MAEIREEFEGVAAAAENGDDDDVQRRRVLTQAQLEAIERDVKTAQPLTSPSLPLPALLEQYRDGDGGEDSSDTAARRQREGFARSLSSLSERYGSLRKVRGDGNCYYRAFLYALCETLFRRRVAAARRKTANGEGEGGDSEFARLREFVASSLKWVCQYGYEEHAIDMFHEELVELLDFVEEISNQAAGQDAIEGALERLHSRLNEENACSDYCTWFLRVLTAAQLKSEPEEYLPFVMGEGYHDISSFCAREVEPMGRECGMIQVQALAECMRVKVTVEYVDGRADEASKHVFGGDRDGERRVSIALLYRPGHYDILY